ncbi:hypothetical protein ACG83_03430 [Frankia sp. R43]|nr:hypothetical protein ACG83_03430 [Frankia sp. R43]
MFLPPLFYSASDTLFFLLFAQDFAGSDSSSCGSRECCGAVFFGLFTKFVLVSDSAGFLRSPVNLRPESVYF